MLVIWLLICIKYSLVLSVISASANLIAAGFLITGGVCKDSLPEAFATFGIIEDKVPRLREYAKEWNKLKEIPWIDIAREIADNIQRRNARLESAGLMSVEQLRRHVQEWRNECETVDKLIRWKLFRDGKRKAATTLAVFSRPGAYEQLFFSAKTLAIRVRVDCKTENR